MNLKLLPLVLGLIVIAEGCGNFLPAPNTASSTPEKSSTTQANGNIVWERYEDPLEQAFTIEVPKGWVVRGGMFRMGMSDHRPMLDITTQDAKINIRVGDVSVPPYSIPTPYHAEGQAVDLGAVGQPISENYRTAPEFAELYGRARFSRMCDSLTRKQMSVPPPAKAKELFEQMLQTRRQQGGGRDLEATDGQATFDCQSVLGPRTAYAYAQTTMISPEMWTVPTIDSYIAPTDQLAAVRGILDHMEASVQFSSAWQQHQDDLDRQAMQYSVARQRGRIETMTREVQQAQAKMNGMRDWVANFERGQARERAQFQSFDDVINNVTPTLDPFGNEHDVSTGPKYGYWYNPGTNHAVNANSAPGPGYQRLTVIPRQ